MVLPLIGAAIGGGANILSAIMGAQSADDQYAWNYATNMYNARQQERARQEAMDYSEKIRGEQKKGGYDAYGNHTYYDPIKGWVTDLSAQQQGLLDYFYQNELPERRGQFQRKAEASRAQDDEANQLLDQFRRVQKENPADLERQLYAKATRGISEAGNQNMEAALRQAARTGNTNTGSLISEFTKQAMDARRSAEQDAALAARDTTSNEYNDERNQLSRLYAQFAGGAGSDIGTSYDPSNVKPDNLLSQFLNSSAQGNSMGFNARSMTGGQLQQMEPNNAWANAAASIGGSVNSSLNSMGSYFDKQQNNALMQQFLEQGGAFNFGGGGIFGNAADRLNYGSSAF